MKGVAFTGCLMGCAVLFAALLLYSVLITVKMRRLKGRLLQLHAEIKITGILLTQGKQYYKRMMDGIERTKIIRHDLSHHFRMIADYCRDGKNEKILSYLEGLNFQAVTSDVRIYCENHAANVLAAYYAGQAKKYGIRFECMMDIPEGITDHSMDLNILLGNALENALEACKDLSGTACIKLEVRKDKEKLLFCLRNSCTHPVKTERGKLVSEKTGSGHGLGMKSIQRVVDKYGGYCNYREENGEFILEIML